MDDVKVEKLEVRDEVREGIRDDGVLLEVAKEDVEND